MTVVFQKPSSIRPSVQAVTKLSKFRKLRGGVSGPVVLYSARVLNAAKNTTVSGSSTTSDARINEAYFATLLMTATPPRRAPPGAGPR